MLIKIQNNSISMWIGSLSSVREYDESFVNIIRHKSSDTFVELNENTTYMARTTSSNTIESKVLEESMLSADEDNFEKNCYYLFTANMQQTVMGKISSEKLIERVINYFVDSFGFMKMDVHVIERVFKSSGDVQVSVVVSNYNDD